MTERRVVFANLLTFLFLNVYHVSDLHLKYTFMSVVALVAAAMRAVVVPITGKLADKISYIFVVKLGVAITILSFIICAFCAPGPYAYVMYVVFTILYQLGISIFGVGIAVLLYGIPPQGDSAKYFAVNSTINGITGLVMALVGGAILDILQKADVHLFGMPVYAQQIMSVITVIILTAMYFFVSRYCKDLGKNLNKR